MYELKLKIKCNKYGFEFSEWQTINFSFSQAVKEFEEELKKLRFNKDKAICLNCLSKGNYVD